jgi:hypothetical protein
MTSDVGVLITLGELRPGEAVEFALDYDALVRAVTSPFVSQRFVSRTVGGASPAGDTPPAARADPQQAP